MFVLKLQLTALALALLLVAIYMFWKQLQAKSCPVHRRWAGRTAIVIAQLVVMFAAILLIVTWFLI